MQWLHAAIHQGNHLPEMFWSFAVESLISDHFLMVEGQEVTFSRSKDLHRIIFHTSLFVKTSCDKKHTWTWTINSEASEYPCLVVRDLQVIVHELNAVHAQFGAVLCIQSYVRSCRQRWSYNWSVSVMSSVEKITDFEYTCNY